MIFTLMTSCITVSVMVVTLLLNDRAGRRYVTLFSVNTRCAAAN